jgi:hypothetical protein
MLLIMPLTTVFGGSNALQVSGSAVAFLVGMPRSELHGMRVEYEQCTNSGNHLIVGISSDELSALLPMSIESKGRAELVFSSCASDAVVKEFSVEIDKRRYSNLVAFYKRRIGAPHAGQHSEDLIWPMSDGNVRLAKMGDGLYIFQFIGRQ